VGGVLAFQLFYFFYGISAHFQAMAYLIFFLQASSTVSIINQTKLSTSDSGIYLTVTTQNIAHDKKQVKQK